MMKLKSREITFQQYGKILLKQEFSDGLPNIHEHKRYYYTFDNSLLFTEHSEHYTNLSTLNHNVRFLRVSTGRWHNAIRVRAKPCVHRFSIPRTLDSSPSGLLDIVNPGMG